MKKLLYSVLVVCWALPSCNEDVLEKKPLDIITNDVVWDDPALVDAYLANVYNEMSFMMELDYGAGTGWFDITYTVLMADEAAPGWEGGKHVNIMNTGNTSEYGEWWGYETVRKINFMLEEMVDAELDADFKQQRVAEARFLRAFAYFKMVERYGGVPLITTVQSQDAPEDELYPVRDKEQAVYDFILAELDALMADLREPGEGDVGRASKAAAMALKSRAAMFAASIAQWGEVQLEGVVGIPASEAVNYWQISYDASRSIIDGAQFSLYNELEDKTLNYRNIFLDENNSEVIFSEIFNGPAGKAHSWDFFNGIAGFHPWGIGHQICAYLEMVEAFENVDGSDPKLDRAKIADGYLWTTEEMFGKKEPRFKAMIITQDDLWTGVKLDKHQGIRQEDGTITRDDYKGIAAEGFSATGRASSTPFQILKYLDESVVVVPGPATSATDYIIFRYAEILLNYAEAAFELGKLDEALEAVNQIRERAGLGALSSIDREAIRQERKIELAFEGTRYFDLRRWRIAEEALTGSFTNMNYILDFETGKYLLQLVPDFEAGANAVFAERHYYLPITLERIANNNKLVENPGYSNN